MTRSAGRSHLAGVLNRVDVDRREIADCCKGLIVYEIPNRSMLQTTARQRRGKPARRRIREITVNQIDECLAAAKQVFPDAESFTDVPDHDRPKRLSKRENKIPGPSP